MFVRLEALNVGDIVSFTNISVYVDGKDTKLTGTWCITKRTYEYDVDLSKDAFLIKVMQKEKAIWIPGDFPALIHETSRPNFCFKELCSGPFRHLGNDCVKLHEACILDAKPALVLRGGETDDEINEQLDKLADKKIMVNAVVIHNGGLMEIKDEQVIPYDS